jgi:tetratricopeptide (TPR) repeat protein
VYLERLETAVKSFQRAGDQRKACQHRVNIGNAYLELGAYEQAEASLEAGSIEADQLGVRAVGAFARLRLALARARLGRVEEAEALARQNLAALRALGDRRLEGVTQTHLAAFAMSRADEAVAEVEARKAVALLGDAAPFQAHAKAVLAQALLRADRQEQTQAAASLAREAFEALRHGGGLEEGESYVRLVHVEALRAAGETTAADAALDGAAERLLDRAARIPPPWRDSFLTRVPENARTLELAGLRGRRLHGGT